LGLGLDSIRFGLGNLDWDWAWKLELGLDSIRFGLENLDWAWIRLDLGLETWIGIGLGFD
jgi:hypothetical protein